MRSESFDILIIGAGPAGIAAACAASHGNESGKGLRVAVVDDNANAGGQIWRTQIAESKGATVRNFWSTATKAPLRIPPGAKKWLERFQWSRTRTLTSTAIVAAPEPGLLLAQDLTGPLQLNYGRLILAIGARERFLPFPGWTSPRVFGAGGLQALVKSGLPIVGKRVIVAGSGPLLPAVAATLKKQGGQVVLIAEQADAERLAPFVMNVAASPGKLLQSLRMKASLIGVPYRTGSWPVAVIDRGETLRVTLQSSAGPREVDCDYLACGFFLVPNLELPALLGCDIQSTEKGVMTDAFQQTTVSNIFAAGEITGIGGLDKSLIEGQIAGHAAADNQPAAKHFFRARGRAHRFAAMLRQSFTMRDELKQLAREHTIVCRCEDVTYGQLNSFQTAREAKLQTRCGMGPCQGRICGPACEFLFGWKDDSIRPPMFPVPLENLVS